MERQLSLTLNQKIRVIILIVLAQSMFPLIAITHIVRQDGTGDFSSIQPAIYASSMGDTVLVSPGRYYENLTVPSAITLASHYLLTNDIAYSYTTIIDGNHAGTTVFVQNTLPDTCRITGLTITNGYNHSDQSRGVGGLDVSGSNLILDNCIVENNYGDLVGGICPWNSSNVVLKGTTIRYNRGAIGGIALFNCNLVFDQNDLCNMYFNYGHTCDLKKTFSSNQTPLEVYADTLTVLNPLSSDGYFFDSVDLHNTPLHDIIIYANHGKIIPINADLYVAPDGNDANSGLTPEEPLQKLCYAMTIIDSDSLQHHTIYLADGTYSASANDQHFPLGLKNWVNIEGQSMDNTIINCGNAFSAFTNINSSKRLGFYIKNLQFVQNHLPSPGFIGPINIGFGQVAAGDSLLIENILMQNCTTNSSFIWVTRMRGEDVGYPFSPRIHLKNIHLLNNVASTAMYFHRANIVAENIEIRNHVQLQGGYEILAVPIQWYGDGNFTLINSLIADNINHCTDFQTQAAAIGISNDTYINRPLNVDIINCTIGNNHSDSFGGGGIALHDGPMTVNIYNTIIYGNTPYEVVAVGNQQVTGDSILLNFNHCLMNPSSVLTGNEITVNYDDATINQNPLWQIDGNFPYYLQQSSPCIDTGTMLIPDSLLTLLPAYDLIGNPRVYGSEIDMGCYEWRTTNSVDEITPTSKFTLSAYPNPFNPSTTITYFLPSVSHVKIEIFNITGQKIITLVDEPHQYGINKTAWNGMDRNRNAVSSGVYFYRLETSYGILTKKMVLIK